MSIDALKKKLEALLEASEAVLQDHADTADSADAADEQDAGLCGQLLIAMPSVKDDWFNRSVVYVCDHTRNGAMGLVINKPSDIVVKDLFDKVDLSLSRDGLGKQPVFSGGPVQTERGFVLHEHVPMPEEAKDESLFQVSMQVGNGLELTTSRDVLDAMANGVGPRKLLVSLGFAAWEKGQLEAELKEGAWLHVEATEQLIFDVPAHERYDQALALLGLQGHQISPHVGTA